MGGDGFISGMIVEALFDLAPCEWRWQVARYLTRSVTCSRSPLAYRRAGRNGSFCRLCCVEATTSDRGALCRPYRAAYPGGHGDGFDDRVAGLGDPPVDRADRGGCHVDLSQVLQD